MYQYFLGDRLYQCRSIIEIPINEIFTFNFKGNTYYNPSFVLLLTSGKKNWLFFLFFLLPL